MKQNKTSQLIHIWEDYEFYLNISQALIGSNKAFIYYYYLDAKTSKRKRIRKYISKCNGNLKQIKSSAKQAVLNIVKLLFNNWSPTTDIPMRIRFNL